MSEFQRKERLYSVGSGMKIAADTWGNPEAPPVILLHGGGQTRHAWGGTAEALAENGFYAISKDLRGHGDSAWCDDGNYHPDHYADDLYGIIQTLDRPPALVGASLGGIVSLLMAGELRPEAVRALVLVDVTPRMERAGLERIVQFMTANPDGYETLDQAADAVAEFLPNRPRPKNTKGLEKNLRKGEDGRYRWHWDPKFLTRATDDEGNRQARSIKWEERLNSAARAVRVPTLLVRGRMSDVVPEECAREFLGQVEHAKFVDVENAAHMVAGDENDAFTRSVVDFLTETLVDSADSSAA
jgi:pimeloyl-ACP methyl ester carboxylesterase